jgi:hypothetical protein
VFELHKPEMNGSVTLSPQMAPELGLTLHVLFQRIDLALGIDNALDFEITRRACPQLLNFHFYRRTTILVNLFVSLFNIQKNWEIFKFGKTSIDCLFCDKCL